MAVKIYKKTDRTKLSTNFRASEFACKGKGCCSTMQIDEKLVEYCQKIRDHFGKAVTINSGYRCATHNKNVGGASGSRHTKGQAADIVVKGIAPAEVAKYAESIGVLGIGLYEAKDGNFVHIDTRTTKSFWKGHAQQRITTFGGNLDKVVQIQVPVLQKGCAGNSVIALQRILSVTADGIFGKNTETAVKKEQEKAGLPKTGICDEQTWIKLLGV